MRLSLLAPLALAALWAGPSSASLILTGLLGGDLTDPDNNGMPATGMPTVNSKGIPTSVNNTPTSAPADTDSDGVRDYRDLDSDNDDLNDVAEATRPDGEHDGIIGTGTPTPTPTPVPTPEIRVTGLGFEIADGSCSPVVGNDTDF